jgi:hypothetical protein
MSATATAILKHHYAQAFITLREYAVNNKDPKTILNYPLIKPNYLDDISPVLKEIRHWAGMRCVELIDLYGWHDIATALGVDSEAQVRHYCCLYYWHTIHIIPCVVSLN